jgi:hypothetical protein
MQDAHDLKVTTNHENKPFMVSLSNPEHPFHKLRVNGGKLILTLISAFPI